MEGPLRGCLAGVAAWKCPRLHQHHPNIPGRILVAGTREVLNELMSDGFSRSITAGKAEGVAHYAGRDAQGLPRLYRFLKLLH